MIFKNNKTEKSVISVRLDLDLLERIDKIATQNDLSRNEVIAQGMKFSLDTEDNRQEKRAIKDKKGKNKKSNDPKETDDDNETNENIIEKK